MLIAANGKHIHLLPEMSNRHGLIAGSTGSGKTVTLQVMAEQFSRIGVPVFLADVKGDLGGIKYPGIPNEKIVDRVHRLGLEDFDFEGNPVRFWDVFGTDGDPLKASVSGMGPLLISQLLDLSEAQAGSLFQMFKATKRYGIAINNLNDLFSVATHMIEHAEEYEREYGRISKGSFGAIQRSLIALEDDGEDVLFVKNGEKVFDISQFIQTKHSKGVINILKAERLIHTPKVYAMFLLWLLTELFEKLPERGDADKPVMVFFFDEAHLLFDGAPKVLVDKIEKVVRLIRSKGVGVFFVTQRPEDIPDSVLAQLGNRVQHSMRAFTPRDLKVIKALAQTFRTNDADQVENTITELKIGEALVSFLSTDGSPSVVQRAMICPPRSRIGL